MPGAGRGERLLGLRRLGPQMVGAVGEVVEHPRVDSVLRGPAQPVRRGRLQMHMREPVDQRGGDGPGERVVCGAVSGADDDRARRAVRSCRCGGPGSASRTPSGRPVSRRSARPGTGSTARRGRWPPAGRRPNGRREIWGTPMRSSGANCVPSRLTHSSPSDSANSLTREDFPMPGAPQMKTGRTVARPSSSSGIRAGVTVTAACTQWLLGSVRAGRAGARCPIRTVWAVPTGTAAHFPGACLRGPGPEPGPSGLSRLPVMV